MKKRIKAPVEIDFALRNMSDRSGQSASQNSHKELLRISAELQSELIKLLYNGYKFEELLNMITAKVGRKSKVLIANACSIYIVDTAQKSKHNKIAIMRAASGYQEKYIGLAKASVVEPANVADEPKEKEKLGVTGWVISTGRAFLARTAKDLVRHPHHYGKFDPIQLPSKKRVSTYLAVPLRNLEGQTIGALKAERLSPKGSFSIEDQLVLETLARVAGRCIIYEQEARNNSLDAAITLWSREVIAEAVASEGELDSFLDMASKVIAAAVRADSCAIFHIDQARRTLTQRAGSGSQALRKVVRAYMMADKEKVLECLNTRLCNPDKCPCHGKIPDSKKVGLTAWIAATGKSFHANNQISLRNHCHWRGRFDPFNYTEQQECGAWMGVPLRVGGATIGVLKVENDAVKNKKVTADFTDDDRRRLELLAQEVAIAVERLQFQYKTRYQVIEEAMPTILEILQGELDLEKLVKRVVEATASLFKARACALFLKEGSELIQRAAFGWAKLGPPRRYKLASSGQIKNTPQPEEKVGLTVWIAVTGKMFTAKSNLELTAHPHHQGTFDIYNFKKKERCESFMGIPLIVAGQGGKTRKELVGVLKVETKMRSVGGKKEFAYFNELDELAFTLIANSAAIAIQNARLLESRRLAERIMIIPGSDANSVVRSLYEFQENRVDVISTLRGAAAVVGEKDNFKADIVSSFTGILEPEFDKTILLHLSDLVGDPIKEMFRAIAASLNARNLDQIRILQDNIGWGKILDHDFFLSQCAKMLAEILREITDHLINYDRDPGNRSALEKCNSLLNNSLCQAETMNPFERSILGRIYQNWLFAITEALKVFRKILSVYQADKPLEADSQLFVGRESTFRWIEEKLCAERPMSLFLHGGWHTGKTSILLQVEAGPKGKRIRDGRRHPVYPIFIDIQQIGDPGIDALLLRIADFVVAGLNKRGIQIPPPVRAEFQAGPSRAFDMFLAETIKSIGDGLLVLMLDEFSRLFIKVKDGMIDSGIFDYLRSIMQHQPQVAFILAARYSLDVLDTQDKTKLYNVTQHREIGFLSEDESEQLIRRPIQAQGVHYDDNVVKRIQRLTGGNPYFIQQICDFCIILLNERKQGYQVQIDLLESALDLALKPGNVATIEDFWKDVGDHAQIVLRNLAELSSEEQPWISSKKLFSAARQCGLTDKDVSRGITTLSAYHLIEQDKITDSKTIIYRNSVDIMRLWVLRQP